MKINDVERWRLEIDLAEKFFRDNFGEYSKKDHRRVGENIDYFERGLSLVSDLLPKDEDIVTTLNLIHVVVKNIVPTITFKNPEILAFPKKAELQDAAPIVKTTMNHYYKEIDVEETNDDVAWDAYVLGHGYSKTGYTTKFGMDIPDEKKQKTFLDRSLEKLGLKKSKEEPVVHPELNYEIVSESPYVVYVSPFDFIRDIRSPGFYESMWMGVRIKKSIKAMKANKKYKNTSKLQGSDPDDSLDLGKLTQSEIEDFKFVDLYQIQYRNDDTFYDLVISKDGDNFYEHYHEESAYQYWQYDELTFNKHRHKIFAVSDITKLRNIQDRFTSTMDAILEQVDKFVPKIAVNTNELTPDGKRSLREGDIGAIVECTKNPAEVIRELAFTQLKGDLKILLDNFIDLISMLTGLTKAQLMGMATADTATAEQIAQSGYTLRISDLNRRFNRFARRQAEKLWKVIKEFVDLEELELINGVQGMSEDGSPIYNWITIDQNKKEKLQNGEYDIQIEVGSTQKADLSVLRKQFENLFSILARTDVIMLMQQQGAKVDLSEILKLYMQLFPEMVKDIGKVIQKITPATNGLLPPPVPEAGGTTAGSNFNALEKQAFQQVGANERLGV